ncbi:MAG: hypothetical protein LBD59_08290 [Prevotellaceae bacterium]|nr:hypothetical protein [Prevotellaceae bacterium]
MKQILCAFFILTVFLCCRQQPSVDSAYIGEVKENRDITLKVYSLSNNASDFRDILQFEGIEYLKLSFKGKDLANKSYHLTVKEIWDGEIKSDTTIINSKESYYKQFQKINDTVFTLTVIAKIIDNKLKMTFKTKNHVTQQFDVIQSEAADYSLRNIAVTDRTEIKYGEKFCLLAYILPYEKNGIKYYCAVENSGQNIETWGKEFGIKHYLVFEMKFE